MALKLDFNIVGGDFNLAGKASSKIKKKYLSLPKGEHGYGRFSFIKFASSVEWETVFESKNKKYTELFLS